MNLTELLTAIADSIRNKKGTTDKINAQNFPTEIDSIVLGSGDAEPADVLAGKTFSNDDGSQTGTMATYSGEYKLDEEDGSPAYTTDSPVIETDTAWEATPQSSDITLLTAKEYMAKNVVVKASQTPTETKTIYTSDLSSFGTYSNYKDVVLTHKPISDLKRGDIIHLDIGLTDCDDDRYRILNINGNEVEVVSMFDYGRQMFNSSSITTTIGTLTVQKYSGSTLDTYLNTTFYNLLSDEAKAAIVAKDIKQDVWYFSWGSSATSGNPDYAGKYGSTNPGTNDYHVGLYSDSGTAYTEDCGNRYIYALSVQDVIDYVTDTTVGDGQLQNYNIWKMFWSSPNTYGGYIWLRSAYADYSSRAYYVHGIYGYVNYDYYSLNYAVRPAFTIDLSKISWS